MAFKLDDIIIDRIQYGYAENGKGELQYALTQLSEGTIEVTAESTDAVDKDGTLIKRFYRAKSGTFTAQNAMINLNILAAASGTDKKVATEDNTITMPKIEIVKAGGTITLEDLVEGSVHVNALGTNGASGDAYEEGSDASDTEFGLNSNGVLTPPTAKDVTQYIVKYDRKVESGVAIENRSDKFPSTVKLTLKALCVDPCSIDTLRACYIVFPSFQVSPEVSVSLQTDTTLEYTGDLQVDYCSEDKVLYYIYMAEEDEED